MERELTSSGAVLFVRYAYPPNELGYCGPEDAGVLLDHGSGRAGTGDAPDGDIARRARAFDGAWPYLEVIAAAAGVEDPLDPRVVEAYWVGNELLDQVDGSALMGTLHDRFRGQVGGSWRRWAASAGRPVAPHHSFQVFEVYPWVGLLGGGNEVALSVLDRCRIRWGQVVRVVGEEVVVRSRPLRWDGRALRLGEPQEERARWAHDGRALPSRFEVGWWVGLHWDWVCDVLTDSQLAALQHYSDLQLGLTNAWLRERARP